MAYFDCIVGGSGKGNTLVVTCADDLAGATITCTNGTKTYTKTCPSTAPYEVTFYGLMAGTWTVSATVSGNTYTTTVVVADIETLLGGFNWRTWVDTARFLDSTDYNSLDEVLADEEAVRELCLEHACVDYLAGIATTNADVETIINTDLFAKWVNNSDYALDFLYANTIIKGYMDTADKYGYGEWIITDDTTTPPTWGPKGNVPKMTSNTAPYGTAGGDADTTSYLAFDGDNSTAASKAGLPASAIIWYKFPTPIKVKRADFLISFSSAPSSISAQVIYSDDGVTWNNATEAIAVVNATKKSIDVEPQGYHLYWGIRRIVSESKSGAGNTIQFYGRELSVSVPTMTGNTTPYGEVTVSSYLNNNNDFNGFRAFDATENGWDPATTDSVNNANLVYKFTSNVNPVMFGGSGARTSSSSGTNVIKLLVSKDGTTWVDTTKTISFDRYKLTRVYNTVNLNEGYKYFKFLITEVTDMSVSGAWGVKLFLYGKDYSEKEFEEGTTKKWLYDHGVELEALTGQKGATGKEPIFGVDSIIMEAGSSNSGSYSKIRVTSAIDFTSFELLRAKTRAFVANKSAIGIENTGGTGIATINVSSSNAPYSIGLDITSINESHYAYAEAKSGANGKFELSELWLE